MHAKLSSKPLLAAFLQSVVLPLFRGDAQLLFISLSAPMVFEALLAPTGSGGGSGGGASMPVAQAALERASALLLYAAVALAVLAAKVMLWRPGPKLSPLLAAAGVFVPGAYYVYLGLLAHGGARFHLALPAMLLLYPIPVTIVGLVATHGVRLFVRAVSRRLPKSHQPGVDAAATVCVQYAVSCVATLWAIAAGSGVAARIVAFSCSAYSVAGGAGSSNAGGSGGSRGLIRVLSCLPWWTLTPAATHIDERSAGGGVWRPCTTDSAAATAAAHPFFLSQRSVVHTLVYMVPLLVLLGVICANYALAVGGLWRLLGTLNVKWSLPTLGEYVERHLPMQCSGNAYFCPPCLWVSKECWEMTNAKLV